METNNLIDRYITEVGKQLPSKSRLDIEAEIRSTLDDMLEERSEKAGRPVDEAMIVEVLKEYGAPSKIAASYQPERYLIGPRLFASFMTVLKVILPIVAAVALVKTGVSIGQVELTFDNIFEAAAGGLAEFLGTAVSALGSMVILFAILQWTLPEFKEKQSEWDPLSLPKATLRDQVEAGSTVLEIFASGLAIVLFNFFPHLINISLHSEGAWSIGFIAVDRGAAWSTTVLSEAFFGYLPALTILWGLTMLLDVLLLSRTRWEAWTRWVSLGLKVMSIVLAIIMLAGPALVAVDANALMAAGFPNEFVAQILVNFAEQGAIVALAITILASVIDAIRIVIRLTGRNLSPALEKFAHH